MQKLTSRMNETDYGTNIKSKTKIHNVVNDFYQEIPFSRLTKKERIILARIRAGYTKITHEYLIKKTDFLFCNRCQKSVTHSI